MTFDQFVIGAHVCVRARCCMYAFYDLFCFPFMSMCSGMRACMCMCLCVCVPYALHDYISAAIWIYLLWLILENHKLDTLNLWKISSNCSKHKFNKYVFREEKIQRHTMSSALANILNISEILAWKAFVSIKSLHLHLHTHAYGHSRHSSHAPHRERRRPTSRHTVSYVNMFLWKWYIDIYAATKSSRPGNCSGQVVLCRWDM